MIEEGGLKHFYFYFQLVIADLKISEMRTKHSSGNNFLRRKPSHRNIFPVPT